MARNRFLIVNADDCNLTGGVTQAILHCHDRGIVTSTTVMINLPLSRKTVRALLKRKKLGIGLHLNVTLGKPVTRIHLIPTLLDERNLFFKMPRKRIRTVRGRDVRCEYENQIRLFRNRFGKYPTHLDTHHQLHDHPMFLKVLKQVAKKYRLPVRRSRLMGKKAGETTDYCFGDLSPSGYWTGKKLKQRIRKLPEGTSEIVCHPGKVDQALRKISSFTTGRAVERRLFASKRLKYWIQKQGIEFRHFGLYT